jgi:hypothetical protein
MKRQIDARLACGCVLGFRDGAQGSPVTVFVVRKAAGCHVTLHVTGQPIYDHREAMRPPTRFTPIAQPDFEDN